MPPRNYFKKFPGRKPSRKDFLPGNFFWVENEWEGDRQAIRHQLVPSHCGTYGGETFVGLLSWVWLGLDGLFHFLFHLLLLEEGLQVLDGH